jgi:hypothetical protein
MFSGVGSKTKPVDGAASGCPVMGLTSRGAEAPSPRPLSRIRLAGQRAEQGRDPQRLDGDPRPGDDLRRVPPGVRPDGEDGADDEQQDHRRHLEHLRALQGDVHHGSQRQDQPDQDQHPDRDVARRSAEDVRGQGRAARGPPRPQVGEVGEQGEDQPPVPPVPAETGQRRLARRERVALDLEVDEVLRHQTDQRRPDEHQSDLGGDVREEDELSRRQAHPGRDDSRTDQLAVLRRRRRQIPYFGPRQVLGGKGVCGRDVAEAFTGPLRFRHAAMRTIPAQTGTRSLFPSALRRVPSCSGPGRGDPVSVTSGAGRASTAGPTHQRGAAR